MGEILAMAELPALIQDYCELLEQESRLEERKGRLRQQILTEMGRLNVADVRYPHGHAQRSAKFKLIPRRDEVLGLLERDDLFAFAQFTPPKVKEILVPKYGRERLLPLFDVQKSELLVIKRAPGRSAPDPE